MDLPSLTNVLQFFESHLTTGRSRLFGDVQSIIRILVTLEVIFAGIYLALGSSADMKGVARKILSIGFFFYVIQNFGDILRWLVDGFLYAGETVGSGTPVNMNTLRDPAAIFIRGMQITKPLADKLFADMSSSWMGIPSLDGLLLAFCCVFSVFCFGIISIQIFVTYLEYLLVATAGFILIPFGIFRPTAFLAERVFGAIIAFGIKLMVLALVTGLSEAFLQTVALPATVSWQQVVELSVIALALAFLSIHAPAVAQSLLTGSPQLSLGTVAAAAGTAAYLGERAGRMGGQTASTTISAASKFHAGVSRAAASMRGKSQATGSRDGQTGGTTESSSALLATPTMQDQRRT